MRDGITRMTLGDNIADHIHGHAKLELFDAKTKELVQKVEDDNLVTNALRYLVNNVAGNIPGYLDDIVMPVATKALGGLMLFDGTLTEDATNVKFPGSVSLTGYALRETNTTNTKAGSLNESESGEISGGYRSVWDFSTSQANGNIYAAALTNATYTPFLGVYDGTDANNIINSGGNVWRNATPVTTDGETVYMVNGSGVTSVSDSTRTTTITINVYEEHNPTDAFKVADTVSEADYPSTVTTLTVILTTSSSYTPANYDRPHLVACNGYDGNIYFIYALGNSSGDGTVLYFTIDTSSWTASNVKTLSLANAFLRATNGVVSDGYMYLISYDGHSVYKVDIDNTANITIISLPTDFYFPTNTACGVYYLAPNRDGGIRIVAYTDAANGQSGYYDHYYGYINTSNVITMNGAYSVRNTATYWSPRVLMYQNYRYMQGYNMKDGGENGYFGYGRILTNYLGTICNLSSPITKNASQTLKVTYELYDA